MSVQFRPPPPFSLLYKDKPTEAFLDCYTATLLSNRVNIDQVIPAFFDSAPGWFHTLFRLRNRLVSYLGLKTGPAALPIPVPPFQTGQQIGLFRIYALNDTEVVMGENDRHLDFRTSLCLFNGLEGRQLAISTWVNPHNNLGHCYFALVKPFHQLIVPAMLHGTIKRLAKNNQP